MLKKLIACILTASLIFSLSACGEKTEKEKPEDNSQISSTAENENSDTKDVKEENKDIVLSEDDQYKINIFISNFAEQNIAEYESTNTDDFSLINFAHMHVKINNNDMITYDDVDGKTYEAITLEEVNRVLEKYLGKQIMPEEGQVYSYNGPENYYSDILFKNNKFNFEPADGESHPCIAVVDKMTELNDGTYEVKFKVYSIFEYSTGGNVVDDKSYYYMTKDQADNSSEMEETGEGEAVVEYADGLYKLLKYSAY